jgi:hypothetical protein
MHWSTACQGNSQIGVFCWRRGYLECDRSLRQTMSTCPPFFSNGSFCILRPVLPLTVSPASKEGYYGLSCVLEQGNNHLIPIYRALVVLVAPTDHVVLTRSTRLATSSQHQWIQESKIAVIPDLRNNHPISFYWLLSSSPSIFVMKSLVYRHVPYLLLTDHVAPRHTAGDILHHQ